MVEIHEMISRDLDPIDDVRRRLQESYTQDYFHPSNGDWISDDYWRIIDLTTQPQKLEEEDGERLTRSIVRLNDNYNLIACRLGPTLLKAYDGVAEQINDLNQDDPNRRMIPPMQQKR